MTLFDRFPNHKRSNKYGGRYTILDDFGHKSAAYKFKLICVVCSKEIISSPEKIFKGQKPCACGDHYYKTPERKLEKILEVSKKKGIFPFIPNIQLKRSSERFEVFCGECDHKWEVTFSYFVHRGRGCPACARQKRYTDEEYIERVNDVGKFKNFLFHSKICDSKLRTGSRVRLECLVCENVWESTLTNTLSGKYSCPCCARLGFNPNRPAHMYLLLIKKDGEIIGYKYGISNVKRRRLSNLSSYNKGLELKCVASWYYKHGYDCKEHESLVKSKFPTHLDKETLPDGYSETVSPEDMLQVFKYINNLYKNRRHGGVQSGGSETQPFNA